jgi:hypothetical protein
MALPGREFNSMLTAGQQASQPVGQQLDPLLACVWS